MASGKLHCPFAFGLGEGEICREERCRMWNRVAVDCSYVVALVTLPPALAELNSHLADLVELRKTLVRVVEASVPG